MKPLMLTLLLLFGGGALVDSCKGPDAQGWCIDFTAAVDTWDSASQDQIVQDTSRLAGEAPDEMRQTANALSMAAVENDPIGLAAHTYVLRQQCG